MRFFYTLSMYTLYVLLFLGILFSVAWLSGSSTQRQMKREVITYVLENKDSIELDAPDGYQAFAYAVTGGPLSSVEYGYYYSEEDKYLYATEGGLYGGGFPMNENTTYKNGYRLDGVHSDPTDWYYTEKICDNWYYYELHDG